ncbi:MAG TPA: ABC transporter substrate-binding protein [Alphaproteobacteria bacterium]
MRRREFIAGLGGAALAWPLTARAQPEPRRVGVLMSNRDGDAEGQARIAAFRDALREAGWIEGRNLRLEIRWAGGDMERIRAYAAELVAEAPAVILGNGTPAVRALQSMTPSIPIVFAQIQDPVGLGIVASMARPGGNITGFAVTVDFDLIGKWLDLLRAVAPGVRRATLLYNPDTVPFYRRALAAYTESKAFTIPVTAGEVRTPDDVAATLTEIAREPRGGLIVPFDAFTVVHLPLVAEQALQHRLPSVSPYRQFAVDGGLIAYGPDVLEIFRRSAGYVDRILKGEHPAELPVQAPTRFETLINLKTATALGLTVPPTLLATADEVIE